MAATIKRIGVLTGGVFLVGVLYDYWTLNEQVHEKNMSPRPI